LSQPETGAFNSDRTVRRQAWAAQRAALEASDAKHMPDGRPHSRAWGLFTLLLQGLAILLRLLGLYERGVRNALDIGLVEHELVFEGLPPAFDGYRVMHMTDLHLDGHPALPGRIARLVEGVACDLCVLTGDYRFRVHGPWDRVTEAFESIMPAIAATDGIVAVLGNHDAAGMADMLESLGARVPVTSTETLSRGDAAIHVTGIDDPHYYFTPAAARALVEAPDGFRIALVHTPELCHQAAEAGFDLYLCGHTHGGQVCLPGGKPVITHAGGFRRYASGFWQVGKMKGYTGRGAGCSGLPIRFNCRGEVTVFTLRRA